MRRRTRPDMRRTFRVPLAPLFPMVGFGFCVWMMFSPEAVTWVVFGVWMAVGLVIHFGYGQRRSRLETEGVDGAIEPAMESGQQK